MNELIEKREYNNLIFFHGVCLDNKGDQVVVNEYDISIDDIKKVCKKFSRYCIAGKFSYDDRVLELGLSMIEFPYPYVRKKAREVATDNLNQKNYFSANIPFDLLTDTVNYSLGTEIKSFNDLNQIFKGYRRGSLMNFFKNKNIEKLLL